MSSRAEARDYVDGLDHPGHGPRFLWTRSAGRRKTVGRQLAAGEVVKVRREVARHAEFTSAVEQVIEVNEKICEARPVAGTDAPSAPEGEKKGLSAVISAEKSAEIGRRGAELGVAGASMSPGLAAMTTWPPRPAPFAGAARLLQELAGVRLDARRVGRAAETSGTAGLGSSSPWPSRFCPGRRLGASELQRSSPRVPQSSAAICR
jgi:hypothetical protein